MVDSIYLKVGETDRRGFRLSDEKGVKDLSTPGLSFAFVIRKKDDSEAEPITMECELGSYVKGQTYTGSQGGLTAIITAEATAEMMIGEAEIVITDNSDPMHETHWPNASANGDEYIPFFVHKSLNH
jgi:hypothetical protein